MVSTTVKGRLNNYGYVERICECESSDGNVSIIHIRIKITIKEFKIREKYGTHFLATLLGKQHCNFFLFLSFLVQTWPGLTPGPSLKGYSYWRSGSM